MRFLFPVGGALLALTTALAAACFVKAFGITFLALPRSRAAAERARVAGGDAGAAGAPGGAVRRAGTLPGRRARACSAGVLASLPGLQPPADMVRGGLGDGVRRRRRSITSSRWCSRAALLCGIGAGGCARRAGRVRGAARADVGLRRRADGADRVHGDGVLEAADDDLPRGLSADAGGRVAGGGLAVLPAARCATARRSSRPSSATSTVRCCARCCAWPTD